MKKIVRGIFIAVIGLIGIVGVVEAKDIGELSRFHITNSFARTVYLTKYRSENHVLNLEPSRNLHPMNVRSRLVNSNGEPRSGENLTLAGTRNTLGNWASPGYIYALDLARQNWWDGSAYITGSWSPDTN